MEPGQVGALKFSIEAGCPRLRRGDRLPAWGILASAPPAHHGPLQSRDSGHAGRQERASAPSPWDLKTLPSIHGNENTLPMTPGPPRGVDRVRREMPAVPSVGSKAARTTCHLYAVVLRDPVIEPDPWAPG